VRDEQLKPRIAAAHAANYGVYGARKVWLTLNRERGVDEPPVARCTVERLMAELGLTGAVRGKVKRTTISDPKVAKPHDLVDRNFRPLAPDRLWVADFTYVSTWSGWCYTAFVIDAYARRILGWSVATNMISQLVVDAVDQAVWTRQRDGKDLTGLIAITITAFSTCPSPTPSTSTPQASSPRLAPSAPRSTTPSPSRSSASTRPN
jgi:putative transposase